ncbi:MAG: C39 family peptidase [Gordonia sp. (in: high G+C Gram-positive bacteria)]
MPARFRRALAATARRGVGRVAKAVLPDAWQAQSTGWCCGPASARIALTCRGVYVSQSQLISEIGTDGDGTDYVGLITPILTEHTGAQYWAYYPGAGTAAIVWSNIRASIDAGFALVVNIVSSPSNVKAPGYPASTIWHYVCVVGYDPGTREVIVADPAYFSGISHWRMGIESFVKMIVWQGKGYTGRPVASNLLGMTTTELTAFADGLRQLGAS